MKSPLSAALTKQLSALATLENMLRQNQPAEQIIAHCFALARELQDSFAPAPEPWLAQTQFIYSDYTSSQNQRFQRMLMALLFSHYHRWHPQSRYGLMCAAMTLDIYHWSDAADKVLPQIKRLQQQIWAHSLIPVARLLPLRTKTGFYRRFSRLSHSQQLLMAVALLSPADQHSPRSVSWPQSLKKMTRQLPTDCYALLEPVIPALGLVMPGTVIKMQNNEMAIILSERPDCRLVKLLDPEQQTFSEHTERLALTEKIRLLPAYRLQDMSLPDKLWDQGWQQLHDETAAPDSAPPSPQPLTRPPAKLLAIQDLLKKEEPDIDMICRHIASEGFLARQLKSTASQLSRMKLQMEEVRHALLFQGFERTSSILVQQALLNRLNQQYFPLQQHLLQFCILLGHVLRALGDRQSKLDTESLVTLGYFSAPGCLSAMQ